jgi:hypothetical protein
MEQFITLFIFENINIIDAIDAIDAIYTIDI